MANGRVKSILDSGYDTTLADFLDKIPQYVLQQQQLNDAKEERAKDRQFQQTQYQNQLAQQRKNNEFRQSQANYTKTRDNLKLVLDTVNKAPFNQRYSTFKNLIANNPDYTDVDINNLESMYKSNDELYKNYQKINDDYDKINEITTLGQFEQYNSMVQIRDDLKNIQGSVSDANLKTTIDNQVNNITKQVKFLESNSGKNYPDDQIPDNLKNELTNLRSRQQSNYNTLDKTKFKLLEYSEYIPPRINQKGEEMSEGFKLLPFPGKKNLAKFQGELGLNTSLINLGAQDAAEWEKEYQTLIRQYENEKDEYNISTQSLNSFYRRNNLVYPELNADKMGTLEDPKEIRSAGDDTSVSDPSAYLELSPQGFPERPVIEDEDLAVVNRNPELAEQFLRQIETGEEKDAKAFKDNLDIQNNYADIISQFNELDNNINQDALIGAGTEEIAVDDREREVIVDEEFNPANDFVEDEEVATAPIALSPVSAGTRSDMEGVVPSQSEKISTDDLFTEPITSDSLNQLNLKDEKGNQIDFNSSARKIDNQLNSMYKKIDNISKQIRQAGSSREEKKLMESNAKEIINNLFSALEASKMEANTVKEKNIKSTVSNFLKNKNTSVDRLKKYYNNLF